MTAIDAQVYIWGVETPEWPWPPGGAALARRPTPLRKDELLREMGAAGVDRAIIVVFWGTDLTQLHGSYRQAVTLFTEELDFLTDIDQTWIMGRGIAAWLCWPL